MATLRVVISGEDHLAALSDEAVSCKGDRHDFPKLRVGMVPKGIKIEPGKRAGQSQLTYTCPDCGTKRRKTTKTGSILNPGANYVYDHPEGYLAPAGAGLTKADYAAELSRRLEPFVKAAMAPRPARSRRRSTGKAG